MHERLMQSRFSLQVSHCEAQEKFSSVVANLVRIVTFEKIALHKVLKSIGQIVTIAHIDGQTCERLITLTRVRAAILKRGECRHKPDLPHLNDLLNSKSPVEHGADKLLGLKGSEITIQLVHNLLPAFKGI